jgi:DNA processing protein
MDKEELFYLVALYFVPGVGKVLFPRLVDRFGSGKAVFSVERGELDQVAGLRNESREAILRFSVKKRAESELKKVEELGFSLLTIRDEGYPPLLSEIVDPPPIIYLKGEFPSPDEPTLAVVGTRTPTRYGRRATSELTGALASSGVVIISGLARGIDEEAHKSALSAGGKTIAVLGSGLDVIYPKENEPLAERISEQGAVISEFPLGTPPERGNFPVRNRVISGLSLGALVVEAWERSGALITGKYALEQSREVFALPGNISSRMSIGTNYLIKQGAKLVQCAEDVIEEFPPRFRDRILTRRVEAEPLPELSSDEMKVYEQLSPVDPIHIDRLSQLADLSPASLLSILLALEIKGITTPLPGNNYLRKR